jgi:hypothetical protein
MGVAKVIYDGTTLVDLTPVTVTPASLLTGATAHDAAGNSIVGVLEPSREDAIINRSISGAYFNDEIESVGAYALDYVNGITSIDLPNVTTTYNQAFGQCTSLVSANLPSLTTCHGSAFWGCTSLLEFDGSNVTEPKAYSGNHFDGCTSLRWVVYSLPGGALYSNDFRNCTSLEIIDTAAGYLNGCCNNCSSLKTLVLRRTNVVTMNGTGTFNSTPMAQGGSGTTVYVPEDFIDSYKVATNWSTFVEYGTVTFEPIEGSYYETHYASGKLIGGV